MGGETQLGADKDRPSSLLCLHNNMFYTWHLKNSHSNKNTGDAYSKSWPSF